MRFALTILVLGPTILPAADGPTLLLPAQQKTLRLELAIRVKGLPPATAHAAFLDRLFDYFDRDSDGSLSAEEAKRVFSLPGPDGRAIILDYARLTAADKASRAAFNAYYKQAGFMAVAFIFPTTDRAKERAGAVLFQALDRDGDGQLSRAELEQAAEVLRKFDADEDEVLTLAELRIEGAVLEGPGRSEAKVKVEPSAGKPDGVLTLNLGQSRALEVSGKSFARFTDEVRFSGGVLRVNTAEADPTPRLRASREFYLAPFRSALGDKAFLELKAIENDSSLAFLGLLAPYADRDGDGRLTLAELETFLDLIEAGVRSRVVVRVADEGASLFAELDEDQDGRLDLRELGRASRLLPKGHDSLTREALPRRFVLEAGFGGRGKTFGPMQLMTKSTIRKPTAKSAVAGPKWFQAMDRNGDGRISPREFLGLPERFAKLDADGDGFISMEEAERAGR